MKDLNYVVGRLHGLNELVKILKDLADKKGSQNPEIIMVIADHISEQLDTILSDFEELEVSSKDKNVLIDIKEKHEENLSDEHTGEDKPTMKAAKEKIEKHEKTVDDLLRDLETLRS